MYKYFFDFENIEDLRKNFRDFCLELHPDKGGNPYDFNEMKVEYDSILDRAIRKEKSLNEKSFFSFDSEILLRECIEKFMSIAGINIEICGSWLWLSGLTFPVRDKIKELGARFSKTKKLWYYSPYMGKGKRKGRYSMSKIRAKYGSETIQGKIEENLIGA